LNAQLIAAANLGILTVIFFISGMIKPQWPMFFLEKPTRFLVSSITLIMVMVVGTLFGEGMRLTKMEQATKISAPVSSTDAVPTPQDVPSATDKASDPQPVPAK
jgi:hypothetical protein